MITCNRCGKQMQAGSANCQYCGMPLTSGNAGGAYPRMGNQEQQELPAWLESLRASEPSEPPVAGQPNFLPADLIDEGSLPGWMRSDNSDMADNLSGPYPGKRRASISAPNTDGSMLPPQGIAAGSLIDERSLPAWLQENPMPGQQPSQRGVSGGSLVQPDALPAWMRNMPPPAAPSNTPRVDAGGAVPMTPAQGMSAGSLIDQQSLPTWLGGQAGQPGQPQLPNATPYSGQGGFPASSLLDMNALPAWMQESNPPFQRQEPPRFNGESMASGQPFADNTPLAAGSLIDMNALPEWLRGDEGQQPGGMPPARQQPLPPGYAQPTGRPGGNGVPHVENMRVPSRPRAEMSPQEQNEAAASVFSSMLGVASAPSFSAQPQYGAMNQQGFGVQPGYQGPQPPRQHQPGMVPPMGQAQPMNAPGANVPGTMQPGWAGAPQAPGYQGGYSMGNQAGTYAPGDQSGWSAQALNASPGRPLEPVVAGQNSNAQPTGTTRQNQNPGKRSIFETIRSWFIR